VRSPADLREALAEGRRFRIAGHNTHADYRVPLDLTCGDLQIQMSGLISHEADDQVVTCFANTPIQELQTELGSKGQCVPYLPLRSPMKGGLEDVQGTLAGHFCINLPHGFESSCGSWKDWLLGAKVMMASGIEAKSGSKVVKSVAGYDVHKFLVGARGTLCVLLEMTLKTFPMRALPAPDTELVRNDWPARGVVQRTLPSDFERIVERSGSSIIATHPQLSTLYRELEAGAKVERTEEDWLVSWGRGIENVEPLRGPALHFFKRAKGIFDPEGRLNPGEFREG
jgi:FAD/FMN-containing dehydrogenase